MFLTRFGGAQQGSLAVAQADAEALAPAIGAARPGPGLGRFPVIAALVGAGMCVCAVTDALSRATLAPSIWLFWAGIALIVAPVAYRLCAESASVGERVALVLLLGLALYGVKVIRDPFGYTMPDEFFHAYNAQQIVLHHRLFGSNPLLPITTKYPGLEGATSALMLLTGMSSFGAGLIVIAVARVVLMLGVFLFFGTVSGSWRVAGLGAAAFAGNSNFLYFGAMFSYESLAMPLFVAIAALIALRADDAREARRTWTTATVFVILALTITHHLTAYLLVAVLAAIALTELIAGPRVKHYDVWRIALFAFAATVGWLVIVASETVGYLTPVLSSAIRDTIDTLTGEYAVRAPFQGGTGGAATPFADKLLTYAYLLFLAVGLPLGLRVIWRRQRRDPIAVLLALGGLGFFGALALRLSPSAWEIANRLDAFLFLGLAFVVAWAVVEELGSAPYRRLLRPYTVAAAAVVVTIGGALTGWEASAILSAPTVIRADGHDIPSETLALAEWTRTHLTGSSYTAAPQADARAILLYGNGRVYMGTTGDITDLLTGANVSQGELNTLHALGIRYVVVDQRARRDDDVAGYGFSVNAHGGSPDRLLPTTLQNSLEQMGAARIYDSGRIAIYDLSGIV